MSTPHLRGWTQRRMRWGRNEARVEATATSPILENGGAKRTTRERMEGGRERERSTERMRDLK